MRPHNTHCTSLSGKHSMIWDIGIFPHTSYGVRVIDLFLPWNLRSQWCRSLSSSTKWVLKIHTASLFPQHRPDFLTKKTDVLQDLGAFPLTVPIPCESCVSYCNGALSYSSRQSLSAMRLGIYEMSVSFLWASRQNSNCGPLSAK